MKISLLRAYENFLPLKVIDIQYLQQCINFEMKVGEKFCNVIILYRPPSQSQDDFDIILAKSPLTIVLGDFYVKSSIWCK